MHSTTCVFCAIAAGTAPATVVGEWIDTIAIVPLNPVCDGHTLVMQRASEWATEWYPHANIITSVGAPATQSVFHLHIHVVPREEGDQLMLPWGTTGDPHEPHWCKVAQGLKDQLDALEIR